MYKRIEPRFKQFIDKLIQRKFVKHYVIKNSMPNGNADYEITLFDNSILKLSNDYNCNGEFALTIAKEVQKQELADKNVNNSEKELHYARRKESNIPIKTRRSMNEKEAYISV